MPEPPLAVSYLFVLFLSISYRHQEVTAVNHHWRLPGLSRRPLGGYLRQTLRTMPKRRITYKNRMDLGFDLVGIDLDGSACQPLW